MKKVADELVAGGDVVVQFHVAQILDQAVHALGRFEQFHELDLVFLKNVRQHRGVE